MAINIPGSLIAALRAGDVPIGKTIANGDPRAMYIVLRMWDTCTEDNPAGEALKTTFNIDDAWKCVARYTMKDPLIWRDVKDGFLQDANIDLSSMNIDEVVNAFKLDETDSLADHSPYCFITAEAGKLFDFSDVFTDGLWHTSNLWKTVNAIINSEETEHLW